MLWTIIIIALAGIIVAIIISVLANWIPRPEKVKTRHVFVLLIILAIAAASIQLLQGDPSKGSRASPSASGNASVERCDSFAAGTQIPTTIKVITTRPELTKESEVDGSFTLRFDHYTWAGYLIELPPKLCDYELSLDAQLNGAASTGPEVGWGYGVGVCDFWANNTPRGFSLQYTLFQDANNAISVNSSWFPMPFVNKKNSVLDISVDHKEHPWIFAVRDNKVRASIDYTTPLGPYDLTGEDLPKSCDGGSIFLRVINSSVTFSNIRVTAL